jgi:hypothetical protein
VENADNFLDEYHQIADGIPFGKVFITVSKDQGRERSAHATYVKSIGKFKDNESALGAIANVIRDIEKNKKSGGAIAITIHPMNGIASQITVQPTDRIAFKYPDGR